MDSTLIMQHLHMLQNEKMHSSLEILSSFLITMAKNNSDAFSAAQQYEILISHADAKYEEKQYQKAEHVYRQALQVRKDAKQLHKMSASNFSKLPSEAEVKYKIHLCCCALGNDDTALLFLESIPGKYRTTKTHYAMAKLYHKAGKNRAAVIAYKEILKKCPMALDVIFKLITLGECPSDILSFTLSGLQGVEWLSTLIRACSCLQNREFQKSLAAFEVLNKKSAISGNGQLLSLLAKVRARTVNNKSAIQLFEAGRSADPYLLDGMDVYAYLLHEEEEFTKLENVANQLFTLCEFHPAPWVALGYRALYRKEYERVVYLTVQATKIDPLCVQATILKGTALRCMHETKDALAHFREAMRIDPHWFVCYTELVATYLPENRITEALAVAYSALNTIGFSPNCLVLCASVHMWDTDPQKVKDKGLHCVDKALAIDPNNKYAIAVKANILCKQKKYEETIKFLSGCVDNYSSSPMHTILAKCYLETQNFIKAVDHFRIALSLNPNNKEAEEGVNKISSIQQDSSFEDQAGDIADNAEAEEANSDSESMWNESVFVS